MFKGIYLISFGFFLTGLWHILCPKGWRNCYAEYSKTSWERKRWAKASTRTVQILGAGIILLSIVIALRGE